MPLPGGSADKIGNRYELRWTVRQFLRLLKDEAAWIHLEPIGPDGDFVEFRLARADGRVEVHQVKRQQARRGHWTIADLESVGVLDGVRRHAIDGGTDYVFVSTQGPKGLPELKLRAEAATDAVAFEAMLTPDLTGDLADFKCRLGQASADQAWGALRRCHWETESEELLCITVSALFDAYVTGEPQAALGILALFALDSVHRRLAAADLWAELARHGIGPSDLARDQSLSARLLQCRDDYLQSQPFGFGDLVLPRAEAQEAATALLAPDRGVRRLFLTGAAGAGKSGVAAQVVEHMAALGWPVLPFRLDRLDPTARASEVGRQLLDRDRSPVALLTGSAAGRDCLLVIEQLDAVGVVSGRHPETFEAVAAMVREAEAHPNLRLLLVCRAFDLDNDARLRDLARRDPDHTQTLTVAPLVQVQIQTVLARFGQDSARLDDAQIRLLSLPLHLALFAEVLTGAPGQPLGFATATAKDLYDAYWLRKRTDLRPVLSDPNAFEALLYRLCNAMNERQALTVPRGLLPPGDADLDRLVSAHVLVRQGTRLGFFHEGFFDYVFARRFCEQETPLLGLLRAGEQGLFCRSQVRQILVYRRDADLDAYLADLGACLGAQDLRPHLKRLMIGLIGQVADPRPEEWEILAAWLPERTGSPTDPVRAALWPSSAWFRYLHDQGVLSAWLAAERPETRGWAANWLGQMAAVEPERVSDLLEGLAGRSPEQDELVLRVASWHGAAAQSARIEALFHRLAAAPGRDAALTRGAYQRFIETHCYGRGSDTRIACRALGRWLALLAETPGGAEAFSRDQETRSVVPEHKYLELAKKGPAAFVDAVVGPFLRLAQLAAEDGNGAPVSDRIWYGGFRGLTHWGPEALLLALVAALKAVALAEPECYRRAISRLRASDHRTAHAVLLRALAVEGGAWVDWALDYLLETRWGLWFDETALWDCRRLLQTLAPHLDAAQVAGLEPWILAHYEPWEPPQAPDTEDGLTLRRQAARWQRRELGQAQFRLLGALPAGRLSVVAKRRLAELGRKAKSMAWAPDQEPRARGGVVVSPVPATATARMTDPQWRSALRAYPEDRHKQWLEDRVLGGARQLAGELEARTKVEPERFARLMLSLPEDTHDSYFEAIVRALPGGSLPLDLLVAVAERAHARPGRPHGRWLPPMIASHGEAGLPPALLDLVAWYATQDPDPSAELWRPSPESDTGYYGGTPHEHGINTARGSAAEALARLIAQGPEHWTHLAPTLGRMVDDPSMAVRTCVAEACTQALRHDRPKAIALFLRLCNLGDALLASPPIERFLNYTAPYDFEAVLPVLSAMLASPLAEARQAGARQVMRAALTLDAARPWADRALTGDAPMRKGAAQVLAANLLAAPDRAYVEAGLIRLFHDPDPEVRGEAAEWTRPFREAGRLGPLGEVADAFLASPAFSGAGIGSLFEALEDASEAPADLLLRAGERFIEVVGLGAGDTAGSGAFTAQTLSELVLRAYRQAEDAPDLRRRCLDLLDRLLEVGGYGTEEALDTLGR